MKLSEKKRIYVTYVETLVMNGYNISDVLNPNYSRINFDALQSIIEELQTKHA